MCSMLRICLLTLILFLCLSFMTFTCLLYNNRWVLPPKICLSKLIPILSHGLILGLSCCMLWQCTTCLIKYFEQPSGASVSYGLDFSRTPLSITICNKGPELDYSFPELLAIDFCPMSEADWETIWVPRGDNLSTARTMQTFITRNSQSQLRLCKTLNVNIISSSVLRLRHKYSDVCDINKMNVFLHTPGLFHAPGFSVLLKKNLFADEKNYILDVMLETLESLPSLDFNCSHEAQGLDMCLLAAASDAAIRSADCIPTYLWQVTFCL